jgi:hypothetical protein
MTEAVQTLEPPTHRYKRGDVREDGKIFWSYRCNGRYQDWLSEEKFLDRKTKTKERCSNWQKENKEKYRHQQALYKENNKEKIKESSIKYYNNNKEKIRERDSKYYNSNKKRINQRKQEWVDKNRDKKRSAQNKYYQKNKCAISRNNSIVRKNRRKTDDLYALTTRVRSLTSKAFIFHGFEKKSQTCKYIGCEWEFLKKYIEQRFQEGMTWENRSEWHIDHIIPLASAKTETQLIKLFHYTNLRPLWAEENLKKWKHQNKQLELIK